MGVCYCIWPILAMGLDQSILSWIQSYIENLENTKSNFFRNNFSTFISDKCICPTNSAEMCRDYRISAQRSGNLCTSLHYLSDIYSICTYNLFYLFSGIISGSWLEKFVVAGTLFRLTVYCTPKERPTWTSPVLCI